MDQTAAVRLTGLRLSYRLNAIPIAVPSNSSPPIIIHGERRLVLVDAVDIPNGLYPGKAESEPRRVRSAGLFFYAVSGSRG